MLLTTSHLRQGDYFVVDVGFDGRVGHFVQVDLEYEQGFFQRAIANELTGGKLTSR